METKILALTGKGGVGKTSLSALIVKILSENFKDKKILAIDADPAIGLATALGVDVKLTLDDIRTEIIETVEGGDTKTALELVGESRYKIAEAIVEKDNFAFLAIGRPESKGCYCRINAYLKSVIEMISSQFDYVVIDCEAGIEQVNRRVIEEVTHLLLVSDASRKGIEVIKSISKLADEAVKYEKIGCIFNRIEDTSLLDDVDLEGIECIGVVKSDKEITRFDAAAKDFILMDSDNDSIKSVYQSLKNYGFIEE